MNSTVLPFLPSNERQISLQRQSQVLFSAVRTRSHTCAPSEAGYPSLFLAEFSSQNYSYYLSRKESEWGKMFAPQFLSCLTYLGLGKRRPCFHSGLAGSWETHGRSAGQGKITNACDWRNKLMFFFVPNCHIPRNARNVPLLTSIRTFARLTHA